MTLRALAARTWLALAACTTATTALAGFDGTTFSTYYAVPDIDTPYVGASAAPSSFVVGAGVDTVFSVEGVTTITVDFSNDVLSLLLNTVLTNPTWNAATFSGLVFDVTAGGPLSFAGYSVDPATTMAGFTAARVGLTGERLSINWNGLSYQDGTRLVVDFAPAQPVPEPETYALMMLGLGALGIVARRRKSRTAG